MEKNNNIAILSLSLEDRPLCDRLAEFLKYPVVTQKTSQFITYIAFYQKGNLFNLEVLLSEPKGALPMQVDFSRERFTHWSSVKKNLLMKVFRKKGFNKKSMIVDLTAGLGGDAFHFLVSRYKVVALERSKLLFCLLAQALSFFYLSSFEKTFLKEEGQELTKQLLDRWLSGKTFISTALLNTSEFLCRSNDPQVETRSDSEAKQPFFNTNNFPYHSDYQKTLSQIIFSNTDSLDFLDHPEHFFKTWSCEYLGDTYFLNEQKFFKKELDILLYMDPMFYLGSRKALPAKQIQFLLQLHKGEYDKVTSGNQQLIRKALSMLSVSSQKVRKNKLPEDFVKEASVMKDSIAKGASIKEVRDQYYFSQVAVKRSKKQSPYAPPHHTLFGKTVDYDIYY